MRVQSCPRKCPPTHGVRTGLDIIRYAAQLLTGPSSGPGPYVKHRDITMTSQLQNRWSGVRILPLLPEIDTKQPANWHCKPAMPTKCPRTIWSRADGKAEEIGGCFAWEVSGLRVRSCGAVYVRKPKNSVAPGSPETNETAAVGPMGLESP